MDTARPLVVPVHNYGAGGNTPPYWLPPPRGLGWRHALFNAYYLRRASRPSGLEGLTAWVDSGAFLFINAPQRRLAGLHARRRRRGNGAPQGWSEELVEEILRRQEAFGADVAFTLDHPLPPESQVEPGCCPSTVAERIRDTARAAALAYQLRRRSSMRILVVLQFNGLEALRLLLAELEERLREHAGIGLEDVDGYAVGGLVPHASKWWLLTRRLQEARKLLGWNTWIHLLGVASPHNIVLLFYAGADSMDSKTYIIAAAKRLYYNPPGTSPARIELGKQLPPGSCPCPACTKTASAEELRRDTRLLTLHNLYVTLQAARYAREAWSEGRLLDLLKQQATRSPRMRRALAEIRGPRPPPSRL